MMSRRAMAGLVAGSILLACNAAPPPQATRGEAQVDHAACGGEQSACGDHGHAADLAAPGAAGGDASLVRVADHGNICMISNRYLGDRRHVPIAVEGKTYFGCCANCAARLGQLASARKAVDPVSGRTVDKATAILARDAQNRISYFESEETFAQRARR